MDLKESDILGDNANAHWYYTAKVAALKKMIGDGPDRVVLDVGAGSGFFSHQLLANNLAREAWCIDTSYAEERDESRLGKAVHYRRSITATDANLVLLMDVLEHVEDDAGLLAHYVQKVAQGSMFLMTVPAFQFLWSGHDEFLEHQRRYTLKQLESVARVAGLKIVRGAYGYGAVFPIVLMQRLFANHLAPNRPSRSDLRKHHPVVNAFLGGACRMELPFMRFNRLAGLTAFCLAMKP